MSKKKISEVITKRVKDSGQRYWSNSNIAEFMSDAEKELLINEVAANFEVVLDSLVIDRFNDPNAEDTGRRLAKMYINETMAGRYTAAPKVTAFPNVDEGKYKGMLVVRSELKSMCSHHHQPVTGVAYIGVLPGNKVIGLSKYTRLAQHVARRGTLQEELCENIAETIERATETSSVGVYIEAEHGCCTNRGIMAHSSMTQTTVLRGNFLHNPSVKQEFFDNIKLQKQGCLR